MRGQYREPKRMRLLSLSKDEIQSIIKSLNSKLASPMFHTHRQLSAMRKRKRDLEARLMDILDDEAYQATLVEDNRPIKDDDINDSYHHNQSRRGKATMKAKAGGYRIRPGPKVNLSYRAKCIRANKKAKGLKVIP
jgi:dGTP triphosphohydrolase